MKINKIAQLSEMQVNMDGVKNVTKKVLVGPDDGSGDIIMRLFTIAPGGHTPYHVHDFEHVVKIEKGKGLIVNEHGQEIEIDAGNSIFVVPNERHQFRNPFDEDFQFICVIPNPNK